LQNKNEIQPVRWAFLAGLIDGDGSINIRYSDGCYQLTSCIYSTSKKLMDWLTEVFGSQYREIPTEGNRKQRYSWYTSQKDILPNLVPYLILKKQQAEAAVLFDNLGNERNPLGRAELMRDIQAANAFYVPANKQEVDESRKNPIAPTKLDYSYLAGLFDAEGSFGIQKRKKKGNGSYTSCARISNTDNRAFLWIVPRFGGRFSITNRKDKNEGTWTLSGAQGLKGRKDRENKLLALVPYLVLKRERAVLFMEWVRNNPSMSKEQKRAAFLEMKALNQRGISPETNTVGCSENEQMIESDLIGDYESALLVTATA
jgi:hypothetical protein